MTEKLNVDVRDVCTCHTGTYYADVDTEGQDMPATWTSPREHTYPVIGAIYDADGANVADACHRLADVFECALYAESDGAHGIAPDVAGLTTCGWDDCGTYMPDDKATCPACNAPQ